ncbi:unnamed protein product, partial [Mycena citricolor]
GRADAQSRVLLSRHAAPHRPVLDVLLRPSGIPHHQHARHSVCTGLHCHSGLCRISNIEYHDLQVHVVGTFISAHADAIT